MLVERDDEADDFGRGGRSTILKGRMSFFERKKWLNQIAFLPESSQVDHSKTKQEQLRVK